MGIHLLEPVTNAEFFQCKPVGEDHRLDPSASVFVPRGPVCEDTRVDPTQPPPTGVVIEGVGALCQAPPVEARVVYDEGVLNQGPSPPGDGELLFTIDGQGEVPSIDVFSNCLKGTCTCTHKIVKTILEPPFYQEMCDIITQELQDGCVSRVPQPPRCVHAMGGVEKSNGKLRPITDCSMPYDRAINNYMKTTFSPFSYNSVSGFGAWCGTDYFYGCWSGYSAGLECNGHRELAPEMDNIKVHEGNINVYELWPVLVGLKRWAHLYVNSEVNIVTDNMQVLAMVNTGRSKNKLCMSWLRELYWTCFIHNIELHATYTHGY